MSVKLPVPSPRRFSSWDRRRPRLHPPRSAPDAKGPSHQRQAGYLVRFIPTRHRPLSSHRTRWVTTSFPHTVLHSSTDRKAKTCRRGRLRSQEKLSLPNLHHWSHAWAVFTSRTQVRFRWSPHTVPTAFFPGTAGVPACINPGQSPTPNIRPTNPVVSLFFLFHSLRGDPPQRFLTSPRPEAHTVHSPTPTVPHSSTDLKAKACRRGRLRSQEKQSRDCMAFVISLCQW